jgi:hypothetical protein
MLFYLKAAKVTSLEEEPQQQPIIDDEKSSDMH